MHFGLLKKLYLLTACLVFVLGTFSNIHHAYADIEINKIDSESSASGNPLKSTWEKLSKIVRDWLQSETPEGQEKVELPSVESVNKPLNSNLIEKTQANLREPVLTEVEAAKEPDKNLLKENDLVPKYPVFSSQKITAPDGSQKRVYRIKKTLPRLDIGQERRIQKRDLIGSEIKVLALKETTYTALPTPSSLPDEAYQGWVTLELERPADRLAGIHSVSKQDIKLFDRSSLDQWAIKTIPAAEVAEKPYQPLSPSELKMLSALILYAKGGQCDLVIGLFDQLQKESPSLAKEARYHLVKCANEKQLFSRSIGLLSQVLKDQDPLFMKNSVEQVAQNLPPEFEQEFYDLVKPHIKKSFKDVPWKDVVLYRLAKGAFKGGDIDFSIELSKLVEEKSSYYWDSHYLLAVSYFAKGDVQLATAKLEGIWALLNEKRIEDKNLRSLVAMNLARMKYNSEAYQEAEELFKQVDKSHSLWVQALIEQGWAQIHLEDWAGAIGNMYSLHSPYFKSVYMPESFAVRAIGYLNICQFGDAYRTITELEGSYRDWKNRIETFQKTHSSDKDQLRKTVKQYMSGASDQDVDGLPHQIIREMGRQKNYINLQKAINGREDEKDRLAGVLTKISEEKERIKWRLKESEERFNEVSLKVKAAKENKSQKKDLNNLLASQRLEKELILGYKYRLALLDFSGKGYIAFREDSEKAREKAKDQFKHSLNKVLVSSLDRIQKHIGITLDNNEFLRYEVFAGSGENIRYQAAGGQVKGVPSRIPAHVKPEKILNWNFSGEYWEDEIGSYRSSLKNLCPEAVAEASQANQGGR